MQKKKQKRVFSPNWQQGYTKTFGYCLNCFIVLTYEFDFGISNKNSARALIEWHIMHLLRSINTFGIQKNNFLLRLRIAGYNLYNQDESSSIICHNLYQTRNSSNETRVLAL